MALFTLKYESVSYTEDYVVLVTGFENTDEQRRQKSPNKQVTFTFKTSALTKTGAQAYQTHFTNQTGGLTSFTFTHPVNDAVLTIRYVPGSFRGSYINGVFRWQFQFKALT